MHLKPVPLNTDEFYHILRKRIFETDRLPLPEQATEVAQGYAKAIRDARQMDVTNASPEPYAQSIAEACPFLRPSATSTRGSKRTPASGRPVAWSG